MDVLVFFAGARRPVGIIATLTVIVLLNRRNPTSSSDSRIDSKPLDLGVWDHKFQDDRGSVCALCIVCWALKYLV